MNKVSASDVSGLKTVSAPGAQVQSGKSERLGYLGMALFLGSLMLAPQDEAEAATIRVNSLADNTTGSDGLVTLREALEVANSGGTTDLGDTGTDPGIDEIVFDPSITGSPGTITLAYGPLSITDSVTISGPGADVLAVDGDDRYLIFGIQYNISTDPLARGVPTASNVTISSLTLQNGNNGGGRRRRGGGGAIFSIGANLTVEDCVITGNKCGGDGGGIFFSGFYSGEQLTVRNTTLSGNYAYYGDGGGIYADYAGLVTLAGSTITGNRADYSGGGVAVIRSRTSLVVTCLISGNESIDGIGGGVANVYAFGPTSIYDSVITGNSAEYFGGGVAFYDQTYVPPDSASSRAPLPFDRDKALFGTLIVGNEAYLGGGAFLGRFGLTSDVTFERCSISGNEAYAGGGICVGALFSGGPPIGSTSYQLKLQDSRIQDNNAYLLGGGALILDQLNYHPQALSLDRCTVSGNFAYSGGGSGPSVYGGGGVATAMRFGGKVIQNSTISGNGGFLGGGLWDLFGYAPLKLSNSTISGNYAYIGAGIMAGFPYFIPITAPEIHLANCTVSQNEAYAGGGLASGLAPVEIHGSVFSGNYAYEEGTDLLGFAPAPFSISYSLIEHPYYANVVPLAGNIFYQDAYLDPLANNGGQTRTHALSVSSPAIDAGINAAIATFDQRGAGYPRTVNGQTDMGAYEYNPDAPPPEQLFGFGNDTDGDGFSDDAEEAAGTDPSDPLDSPLGKVLASEDQIDPLAVLKLQVTLNFSKPGVDKINLKGRFALPDDTPIAGAAVLVDVAGNSAGFVLGDNPRGGTATSGGSKIKLTAPKGGVSTFVLSMVGDFQALCAQNADMENETTAKLGEGKIVRVALNFSNVGVYRGDVVVSYKATQGKTGKAK
ncbi:MAG: right-handed parallel beta-helix repeat-containing protein [Planctomycetes bacterium]|nr:right-handed parallel beta-helix repeat-containing protein [Planctomycetota bacterium]